MATPYTDNTTSARSYLSFQLNFMMLMLNAGRIEEAQTTLRRLSAGIMELPADLHIEVTDEMIEG